MQKIRRFFLIGWLATVSALADNVPLVDYRQVKKRSDNVAATSTKAQENKAEEKEVKVPQIEPVTVPVVMSVSKVENSSVPQEIVSPLGKRMKLEFHDEFDGVIDADGERYIDHSKWLT
jgi:hypothetical protein